MRIVNYNEFITLPKGTVYAFYTPCSIGEIMIKQEQVSDNDWYYSSLCDNVEYDDDFISVFNNARKEDVKLDFTSWTRDGMFDYEREFAIYSKDDIQDMINTLIKSI